MSKKLTIEEMHAIAKSRNGKCLSDEYINTQSKLTWQCEYGHIWKAKPNGIKHNKRWCPYCAGKKIWGGGLKQAQEIAKRNNGKCLSNKYVNSTTKMKFECCKGHVWETTPFSISQGHWCSKCANGVKSIDDMNKLASKKNGKCLSKEYINAKTNLKWQCANKHTWMAIPDSIKRGSWCPFCKMFYNEEKCRFILESLFDRKFPKTRKLFPPYEIDGYNEELKLAFEYNGEQHYKPHNVWHNKERDLNHQIKRDKKIKNICKKNNINLIVIPYTLSLSDKMLEKNIKKYLKSFHYKIKNNHVLWSNFYKKNNLLENLQQIAKLKGGELISEEYNGASSKLEWKCSDGHRWLASPNNIKQGSWCPICANKTRNNHKKLNIEKMHEMAKKRKGKCLSKKYVNIDSKLKWECDKGHTWESIPYVIKSGSWCPICAEIYQVKKYRGYYFSEIKKKYISYISIKNNSIALGSYVNEHHAKQVRKLAVDLYGSGERDPDAYKKLREDFKKSLPHMKKS